MQLGVHLSHIGRKAGPDSIRRAAVYCQVAEHCWDPVGHAIVRYGDLFDGLSQARQREV